MIFLFRGLANPSRSDASDAAHDPATHSHRIASDIKHLLVAATPVHDQTALEISLVDSLNDGAARHLFAAKFPDEHVKVVLGIAEKMMELVRIIHIPEVTYPRGNPNTRSPMMLRWISLVPPAIVYCRAPNTRWSQRGASGTASVGASRVA